MACSFPRALQLCSSRLSWTLLLDSMFLPQIRTLKHTEVAGALPKITEMTVDLEWGPGLGTPWALALPEQCAGPWARGSHLHSISRINDWLPWGPQHHVLSGCLPHHEGLLRDFSVTGVGCINHITPIQ